LEVTTFLLAFLTGTKPNTKEVIARLERETKEIRCQ